MAGSFIHCTLGRPIDAERAQRIGCAARQGGRKAVVFGPGKYIGQRDLTALGITFLARIRGVELLPGARAGAILHTEQGLVVEPASAGRLLVTGNRGYWVGSVSF